MGDDGVWWRKFATHEVDNVHLCRAVKVSWIETQKSDKNKEKVCKKNDQRTSEVKSGYLISK